MRDTGPHRVVDHSAPNRAIQGDPGRSGAIRGDPGRSKVLTDRKNSIQSPHGPQKNNPKVFANRTQTGHKTLAQRFSQRKRSVFGCGNSHVKTCVHRLCEKVCKWFVKFVVSQWFFCVRLFGNPLFGKPLIGKPLCFSPTKPFAVDYIHACSSTEK